MQDRPRMRSRLHSTAVVKTETVSVPDVTGSEERHPTQVVRRYGSCHREKSRGVETDVVNI